MAARSAAAMYAAAAAIGVIESLAAGPVASDFAVLGAAVVVAVVLALAGERLPRRWQDAYAPLGSAMIGIAITTNASGEGALLYTWPAIFAGYFSSRRAVALGVAWTAVVHAAVVWLALDRSHAFDSWCDVVASVTVVSAAVTFLRERNAALVARLEREARTDALTGLLNRRAFAERLDAELARARRSGAPVCLAVIDADHFKAVNDEHGHAAGDRALARLAAVLRDQARGTDVIARMGGEEFAAVLADGGLDGGREYARRVHAALAGEGTLTVSIGVAAARPGDDADALLREADDALYRAKREGRNRTVAAEPQRIS